MGAAGQSQASRRPFLGPLTLPAASTEALVRSPPRTEWGPSLHGFLPTSQTIAPSPGRRGIGGKVREGRKICR